MDLRKFSKNEKQQNVRYNLRKIVLQTPTITTRINRKAIRNVLHSSVPQTQIRGNGRRQMKIKYEIPTNPVLQNVRYNLRTRVVLQTSTTSTGTTQKCQRDATCYTSKTILPVNRRILMKGNNIPITRDKISNMPGSPSKKTTDLLPDRPDTKALNKLLHNLPSAVKKSPKTTPDKSVKSRNLRSVGKKYQNDSSQRTLKGWLSKPDGKITKEAPKNKKTTHEALKPLKITTTKVEKNITKGSEHVNKSSKKSSKPTLNRYNSASSDELPSFKEKISQKRPRQTETFKKYGVIVPSLDEIVADQKKFSNYKIQVEEAQTLREPSFKMVLSPHKSNQSTDKLLLDCKHLTIEKITDYFNNNICFLRDIINGKTFSDRHRRYFDKKNKLDDLTTKDLTYNTSSIVFTFEQLDHMISLMRDEFDPDDNKTCYFFKVLIPELCLKIFMETHNMNKREANVYLESRPIE